ncbi:hypothetical protein PMAYCL1PPCAC_20078, partial [Pristionchus mayeri]
MMSALKDSSIFLPLNFEQLLVLSQRIAFGISCTLHIPAIFCLLWKTPPHQSQIKPNLVSVQICVIVVDLYYSILFEPILIAEEIFIYCSGALCHFVPVPVLMGLLIFVIAAFGVSTLTCIVIRHQAMMPESSRWKARKVTEHIILISFMIAFFTPTITFTVFPFDFNESER